MKITNIIFSLENGLKAVSTLTTVFHNTKLEQIASISATLIDVAQHTLELIDKGEIVAHGRDKAVITSIRSELQAHNDQLAAKIAAS